MTVVKEMLKERVRRVQVHDYVQKKTNRAGFGGLSIQRTPLGTHVRIAAERPGLGNSFWNRKILMKNKNYL